MHPSDAAAAVQQHNIENGPRCHCGDVRRMHLVKSATATVRVTDFDGPCRQFGCPCKTYRPMGIPYHELAAREFEQELAAFMKGKG